MLAASPTRPSSSVLRVRVSPAARTQIGLFGLAYLLYSAARWVTVGDLPSAQAHAAWIVDLEDHLGVGNEASVQDALSGTWAIWLLNHLYLAAQLVVVPGALIFLYRRSRTTYERLRNTILATWLISIPVYALFPVAPPRLADIGMLDTITQQTGFSMDSKLTTSFYNELAAVPSLHVGFAVAVGVAIAASVRNPLMRLVALLWGPTIGLAVVATGNHFVFDIAAGLVASAAGYGLGTMAARASARAPRQVGTLRPAFAEA
jgi:membrane-associated phospholipid phosphatase